MTERASRGDARNAALATLGSVVGECQLCGATELRSLLFLGYVPPLNQLYPRGEPLTEEVCCPAEALYCDRCHLVQLGFVLHEDVLFPPAYPYVSGTTRVQRENFADLHRETTSLLSLKDGTFVVDVGSNNGSLLSHFHESGQRVLGVEPTHTASLARDRGIPTVSEFFRSETARRIREEHGHARLITATNVLAHVGDVHELLSGVELLLDDGGVFTAEVQDLYGVIRQLQYDSFYHEHIRYYSLETLSALLSRHGLTVFRAKRLETHGGSLRIHACKGGKWPVEPSVERLRAEEAPLVGSWDALRGFAERAMLAKLRLQALIGSVRERGERIYAIGAASRASMLIHYTGLDRSLVECALEIPGSPKIGTYLPGTLIPIENESRLFSDPPDHALILSWHVAHDLMPRLRTKGFQGGFLVPLPEPELIPPRSASH